jgi:hypothetical protein
MESSGSVLACTLLLPMPLAAWSKACVCGYSIAANEGQYTTGEVKDRFLELLSVAR